MVCLLVCLSVTTVSLAKAAEPIMPLGMLTPLGPRNHILDGGPDHHTWRGMPGQYMSNGRYMYKSDSAGTSTVMVHVHIGVY